MSGGRLKVKNGSLWRVYVRQRVRCEDVSMFTEGAMISSCFRQFIQSCKNHVRSDHRVGVLLVGERKSVNHVKLVISMVVSVIFYSYVSRHLERCR